MKVYLLTNLQPLVVLLLGLSVFALTGYIHWRGDVKGRLVRWIASHVFGGNFRSEVSAHNLLMVVTSVVVALAWIWTGLAIAYLLE